MKDAPKGMRLHVGLFGRRNVGKSSLLNALTRQQVSIVSAVPGTTTDPVEKPMEFLPLGPVLFIDTAGIDDAGALGRMRSDKTRGIFDRTDLGMLVAESDCWGPYEERILAELRDRQLPVIVVFNKIDIAPPREEVLQRLRSAKISCVLASVLNGKGVLEIREALIRSAPEEYVSARPILGDLIAPGELVVLVVPIDMEAPRGRLILPQVQSIRDVLDHDAYCLVVKERDLRIALDRLHGPPALVVTDSQAFLKVAGATPPGVPMTSFSILFARLKGDLDEFVRGVGTVDRLCAGDRILVLEACSHHPIGEDIGRVKIPHWMRQHTGVDLEFTHLQGHDFPDDLRPYKLVVHCGSCMMNRREVMSRILRCRDASVPITNYGIVIAHSLGILDRALSPFSAYRR